jgi:hypothetical protein
MLFCAATLLIAFARVIVGRLPTGSQLRCAISDEPPYTAQGMPPLSRPGPHNTTVVRSQSDVAALADCETIYGDLVVRIENGTTDISIPGVKHITGSLYLRFSDRLNITSFSMESLVSIAGEMLSSYGTVTSINLPRLSTVGEYFILEALPGLANLDLSNLTAVGTILLSSLPALESLNFTSGLKQVTGFTIPGTEGRIAKFIVQHTALKYLDGLKFPSIHRINILDNPHLSRVELALESTVYANPREIDPGEININFGKSISISGNPGLELSLPHLKTISGFATFMHLSSINIPQLRSSNETLSFSYCTMQEFIAPSLVSVAQQLIISKSNISKISLPAFQTAWGLIIFATVPASCVEGGISTPNLVSLQHLSVATGDENTHSYCQLFAKLRCRGLIKRTYQCGTQDAAWASDPNQCQNTRLASSWTSFRELTHGLGLPSSILAVMGLVYYCYRYRVLQRLWRRQYMRQKGELKMLELKKDEARD